MVVDFLNTIHAELQWLPKGNIEDAWQGIVNGVLYHELRDEKARTIHDQWIGLTNAVGWASRQMCKLGGRLDRIKKRDEDRSTHTFCYLADTQHYDRKSLDQALQGHLSLKLLRLFKDISSRPQSVQARHNSLRIVLNQGRWLNRLHRSRLTLLSLPLQPGGYK